MSHEEEAQKAKLQKEIEAKAHQALHEMISRHSVEVTVFEDLVDRAERVEHTIDELTKQKLRLQQDLQALDNGMAKLHEWEERNRDKLAHALTDDIDTICVGGDARTLQLMDLVGVDRGLKDTMYCLDKAFERNVIESSEWLKSTRMLSKDQYMARALVRQIVLRAQERRDKPHPLTGHQQPPQITTTPQPAQHTAHTTQTPPLQSSTPPDQSQPRLLTL